MAGIHAVTRIASMELSRYGITVNAIAPNAYTRMTRDLPGIGSMSEETFGPQFMAPLVCFLASDQAAHVTGQTFGVNINHLFVYKMMTSQGVDQMSGVPWDPEKIGAVIDRVINW
jgi:NAD(P)-dependent dehydrogenase (short-subunit alcohol dehydrogenase family)